MAEQKLFAGPRIRRIRVAKGLTQTAMADGLGISPSYLNLIERNQRPLTVQLVLKLASIYKVEPEELQGEAGAPLSALREVFSDSLLSGELPGEHELVQLAEVAPNAAGAMVKLYRGYREQAERLSDLTHLLAAEGRAVAGARLPSDEVKDAFERRPNYFSALEEEADAFRLLLVPGDDLRTALHAWLKSEHGIAVRVLPVATMPNWKRRYDRHSQRLFISERLSIPDQLREIAIEAALLRMSVVIGAEVQALALTSDEARRIARFELARYAAHALMMPYEPFLTSARRARYDVDVLRARFGVSFDQAATRLTTLSRPGMAGIPFFMLEIDHSGHRLRRAGSQGFPHRAFGGACPRLAAYDTFSRPAQIAAEAVETPEGVRYLTVSRTVDGPQAGFDERPRRTALLLACDLDVGLETIYGDALPMTAPKPGKTAEPRVNPIGPACRLCERQACLSRAEPPVTRPLGLDEMSTGLSAYDFR